MPHVTPLADQEVSADAKPIIDSLQQKLAMVPNIYRTMAYVPKVLEGETALEQGIHTELPGKLRELAYLKASTVNQCDY